MKSNHSTTSPIELKSTDRRTLGTFPFAETSSCLPCIRRKWTVLRSELEHFPKTLPFEKLKANFPGAIGEKNR